MLTWRMTLERHTCLAQPVVRRATIANVRLSELVGQRMARGREIPRDGVRDANDAPRPATPSAAQTARYAGNDNVKTREKSRSLTPRRLPGCKRARSVRDDSTWVRKGLAKMRPLFSWYWVRLPKRDEGGLSPELSMLAGKKAEAKAHSQEWLCYCGRDSPERRPGR